MKITVLGCGTSTGVPRIGGDWGACDPKDPRNRRTRSSIVVEAGGVRVLVDTGPDLAAQMLACGIDQIDAVLWTHDHADHCHGIDDLRQLSQRNRAQIPGYGSARTMAALRQRFSYIFQGNKGYPTVCTGHEINSSHCFGEMLVECVEQPHGPVQSTGLLFKHGGKSMGYAIDFSSITDDMVALYRQCDLLILDALRHEPHPTHAHIAMSLELGRLTGARRLLLSHMDKSLDFSTLSAELPAHAAPAHDGLVVTL